MTILEESECLADTCGDGVCVDKINGHGCECVPGTTGRDCERGQFAEKHTLEII